MEQNKLNLVIGYTEKLFSDGLESIIDGTNGFSVIDSVPIGTRLLTLLDKETDIDILIIELNYPCQANLNLLNRLKEEYPLVKILLLSQLPGNNMNSKLIDSGIDAFLLKSCTRQDMLTALDKIKDDKNFFCSDIIKLVLSENKNSKNHQEIILTSREKEILAMLVACRTNKEISNDLLLSENTVKTHRKNILNKFGVNNLIGMIRFACRANLLDYGPDGFCKGCPHHN